MKIYVHSENIMPAIHQPILGMAVIDPTLSGLPYEIWLDPAGKSRNIRHHMPRLKVCVDGEQIPFTISDNPKQAASVRKKIRYEAEIISWIRQNKEVLLKQWNREITDKEINILLGKIKGVTSL